VNSSHDNWTAAHPRVVLTAIIAAAAALRLFRLGALSVWLDEGWTAAHVSLPWSRFVAVHTTREANMGLYNLVMRAWLTFGDSETWLRLPSALASIAAVAALYALARRMFGVRVGLVAAALLAVHSGAIIYAQEARGYSLLVLMVLLSWVFLLRVLERPGLGNCAGFVVMSVFSVYTHFFAALSLAAQGIALIAVRDARTPWRRLAACAAVIVIALAPLGYFVLYRDVGQIGWTEQMRGGALMRTLAFMAGVTLHQYRTVLGIGTLVAYGVALALSAVAWMRVVRAKSPSELSFTLAWSGAAVPLAAAALVSVVKPVLIPRYLIECIPFVMLLAAAGVCAIERRRVATAAIAALICLGLFWDANYFANMRKDDWRTAVAYVLANYEAGDTVAIFHPANIDAFAYYQRRFTNQAPSLELVYPAEDDQARILATESWKARESLARETLIKIIDGLDPIHARLWLVLSQVPFGSGDAKFAATVEQHLGAKYRAHSEQRFSGLRVRLYTPRQ
jgi:4-amino-4-deoxy-L-arabinose transferase-like glycosyltransferase